MLLIVAVAPLSRPAAWLLAPYLVWVTFAAVLNLAIVQLNAGAINPEGWCGAFAGKAWTSNSAQS